MCVLQLILDMKELIAFPFITWHYWHLIYVQHDLFHYLKRQLKTIYLQFTYNFISNSNFSLELYL